MRIDRTRKGKVSSKVKIINNRLRSEKNIVPPRFMQNRILLFEK
jgi:hypothetical protein